MPTITDPTSYPEYTIPGIAFDPFTGVTVGDVSVGADLTISVDLAPEPYQPNAGLGTISDLSVPSIRRARISANPSWLLTCPIRRPSCSA